MRTPFLWTGAPAAALALALASCSAIEPINAPAPGAGNANFSTYAAMGTSVTAGTESGGLVVHHQTHSYAALFARQAGASAFTEPTVSADGLPPLLQIVSLSPLIISNQGRTPGTPTNALQPTTYHNMGVPGALLLDCADSTYYYGGLPGRGSGAFDLIVRHRPGTILTQVAQLNPTFVSLEYGANEVLGPATNGSSSIPFPPATFQALLHGTIGGIQALMPNAKMALFTVPDVTSIPFFTTFPPLTVNLQTGQPLPLIGPGGTPLGPGDFVLLTAGADLAGGKGFPANGYNYVNPAQPGTGVPLDDSEVLSANEANVITSTIDGYNSAIRTEAGLAGAAVVDQHALLQTAATVGVSYQGTLYNADFVTGGLFSLDGVHPTDLAHGFLANTMIDAVNATYGSHIPPVNLSEAATATASRLKLDSGGESRRYPVIQGGPALYRAMFPMIPAAAVAARISRR
jgi:hypothetical protein